MANEGVIFQRRKDKYYQTVHRSDGYNYAIGDAVSL